MASPPFDINQALPGDSDIVSQHPTNARAFRDIVESWLLINHDTNGDHFKINMPYSAVPATPPANKITIFASTTGRLKLVGSDGSVLFVGVPAGNVEFTASATTPLGWLDANGQLVNRASYADLFAAIGTTYGAGDGSTTFALPDITGRVIAGADPTGVRLSATLGLGVAANLGAVGGFPTSTLLAANLPPYTPAGSVGTTTTSANGLFAPYNIIGGSGPQMWATNSGTAGAWPLALTSSSTFTGTPQGGSNTAFSNVGPTIILRPIIKI